LFISVVTVVCMCLSNEKITDSDRMRAFLYWIWFTWWIDIWVYWYQDCYL